MHGVAYTIDVSPEIASGLFECGLDVREFEHIDALLQAYDAEVAGCLVASCRTPLQRAVEQGALLPKVAVVENDDLEGVLAAIQAGVSTVIDSAWSPETRAHILLLVQEDAPRAELQAAVNRLTGREREILDLVLRGISSKAIAQRIGTTLRTVETHRAHILRKMGVRSPMALLARFRAVELTVAHTLASGSTPPARRFRNLRRPNLATGSDLRVRLFIAGNSILASHTVESVRSALEERYGTSECLEVIDVLDRPDLAERERILATPTLTCNLRAMPRLVGDVTAFSERLSATGAPPRIRLSLS